VLSPQFGPYALAPQVHVNYRQYPSTFYQASSQRESRFRHWGWGAC